MSQMKTKFIKKGRGQKPKSTKSCYQYIAIKLVEIDAFLT